MGLAYAEEEAYIKVFLAQLGDFSSYNESREAKRLVIWLRSFGVPGSRIHTNYFYQEE